MSIKALQAKIGATPDGAFGPADNEGGYGVL
jgi:hypothetical protein